MLRDRVIKKSTSRRMLALKSQALRHSLWKISIRMGTSTYRLRQIRKIVYIALEHLHIAGSARVLLTQTTRSDAGLMVIIEWGQQLEAVYQLAVRAYIRRKLEEAAGLIFDDHEFEVLFREPPTESAFMEPYVSSRWIRARIHDSQQGRKSTEERDAMGAELIQMIDQARESAHDHEPSGDPSNSPSGNPVDTQTNQQRERAIRSGIEAAREALRRRRASKTAWMQTAAPSRQTGGDSLGDRAVIEGFLTGMAPLGELPESHQGSRREASNG